MILSIFHNSMPDDRGTRFLSTVTPGRNTFVVIILMENRDYGDVIGNLTAAPYLNYLANAYGLATNYHEISFNGSLPNYLGLIAGGPYTPASSCNRPPTNCNGFPSIRNATLIDLMETAGLTWTAYMEDMPSNCYTYNYAKYAPRHDPFVYLAKVINDTSECAKVEPAGYHASRLVAALNSPAIATNLMWLTPNLCNDMHDCTTKVGDTYLSGLIPQILESTLFRTRNAALFVTWDEGRFTTRIPAIWAGSAIKNIYTTNVTLNHYSFLNTLELLWDLPSLTNNDLTASPMTSFFGIKVQLSVTTQTPVADENVSFTGSVVQGVSPFQDHWNFGDGTGSNASTPIHSYDSPGTYNVTLGTSDSLNHTAVSTARLTVAPEIETFPPVARQSPTLLVELALVSASGSAILIASHFLVRRIRSNRRYSN